MKRVSHIEIAPDGPRWRASVMFDDGTGSRDPEAVLFVTQAGRRVQFFLLNDGQWPGKPPEKMR